MGTLTTNTIDLSDRIIHFTLPVSNVNSTIGNVSMPSEAGKNNTGTKSSPATIGAFETIVTDSTINSFMLI